MCALFQVTSPVAMRPAFRPSQWHGHVVISLQQLRTSAARTTFKNAKRHERHSPDGQRTGVVVPATMHGWELYYVIMTILLWSMWVRVKRKGMYKLYNFNCYCIICISTDYKLTFFNLYASSFIPPSSINSSQPPSFTERFTLSIKLNKYNQ